MKTVMVAGLLVFATSALPVVADTSARAVEGRIAAATIEGEHSRALVFLTVGEQSTGTLSSITPVRTACVEVIDYQARLVDTACARADVFIDDLALTAEGADALPSGVFNEFNEKVADSVLTFSGTWTADLVRACEPGWNQYASAPVFIASDLEIATFCAATADVSITSAYFGEQRGTVAAATGMLVGSHVRG